jgi:hypothetical protein
LEAAVENVVSDATQSVEDGDASQVGAVPQRSTSNIGYTFWDGNASQTGTSEGSDSNAGDTVGNGDTVQLEAASESIAVLQHGQVSPSL